MIQSFIFFPEKQMGATPSGWGLRSEDVWISVSGQAKLFGWMIHAPQPHGIIIFFHGNAGNISHRLEKAQGWVQRGFSVLLTDYRGFGKSTGVIDGSEQMVNDARQVVDWVENRADLALLPRVFYGESIGCYCAIRMAGERAAAAAVLEAPFTSLPDMARIHYAWMPSVMLGPLLSRFSFSNLDFIGQVRCPVMIMHGTEDEICPYEHARALFAKTPEPKTFFQIPGGMHNTLPDSAGRAFWDQPADFVRSCLKNQR